MGVGQAREAPLSCALLDALFASRFAHEIPSGRGWPWTRARLLTEPQRPSQKPTHLLQKQKRRDGVGGQRQPWEERGDGLGVVRKHVQEAEVVTDIGAELSVRLPALAAPRFPNLFLEVDRKLPSLGMEYYGLSMVSLEEVFLRIASGEALKSSDHLMDVPTLEEHSG